MTQEALKLALEALEKNTKHLPADFDYHFEAITAIKEALAQTQEPWCMKMNGCKTKCEDCPDEPPQRTWVGLTDEEVRKICVNEWGGYEQCRSIEAKLKEKNT